MVRGGFKDPWFRFVHHHVDYYIREVREKKHVPVFKEGQPMPTDTVNWRELFENVAAEGKSRVADIGVVEAQLEAEKSSQSVSKQAATSPTDQKVKLGSPLSRTV